MRIVFLGSGAFAIPSLQALLSSDHTLALVVTQPDRPAGRGRKFRPTPVAEWAGRHNLPLLHSPDVNSSECVARISQCRPELLVVISFGQKIGQHLIDLAPKGAINAHASLLPKYRGAAPVNWAIINGETKTGISIITVAPKIDAGDILAQAETQIRPDETAEQLEQRLAEMAPPLLLKTIQQIADGTATYTKQDQSKATLAPRLKKSDGRISFDAPAEQLQRRIHGLWPWPGASARFVSLHGGKSVPVILAAAEPLPGPAEQAAPPGTIDKNRNVICGKGLLKIGRLKPQGSRLMDFAEFVNGWHVCCGDRFEPIEP